MALAGFGDVMVMEPLREQADILRRQLAQFRPQQFLDPLADQIPEFAREAISLLPILSFFSEISHLLMTASQGIIQ